MNSYAAISPEHGGFGDRNKDGRLSNMTHGIGVDSKIVQKHMEKNNAHPIIPLFGEEDVDFGEIELQSTPIANYLDAKMEKLEESGKEKK